MDINTKSKGLVLSGGGTKGLAHAGALKFMGEKNIKPKYIAGTSAGAIVGALFAAGKSPEEILFFIKSIDFFNWKHFTFKKAGIIDSEAFKRYFKAIFGEMRVGDLQIPVYITATDMIQGKLKIFGPETKVVDAVLASASFPGVLSPYEINGKLYSDGGILNHFPTDILQGRCDTLIGVYVSPLQKIQSKNLTSIKAVTARALDLLSANSNSTKYHCCDWIITPEELALYSTFETSKPKMDAIFHIGYAAAKKSYEELLL